MRKLLTVAVTRLAHIFVYLSVEIFNILFFRFFLLLFRRYYHHINIPKIILRNPHPHFGKISIK